MKFIAKIIIGFLFFTSLTFASLFYAGWQQERHTDIRIDALEKNQKQQRSDMDALYSNQVQLQDKFDAQEQAKAMDELGKKLDLLNNGDLSGRPVANDPQFDIQPCWPAEDPNHCGEPWPPTGTPISPYDKRYQ
jgi:hypothetical protein